MIIFFMYERLKLLKVIIFPLKTVADFREALF